MQDRIHTQSISRSPSAFGLWDFKMRLSSIHKNIERIEVIHISSSWVQMRRHTENQLHRLPSTSQIAIIPGVDVVWWCGFLTDKNTTLGQTRLWLTQVVAFSKSCFVFSASPYSALGFQYPVCSSIEYYYPSIRKSRPRLDMQGTSTRQSCALQLECSGP